MPPNLQDILIHSFRIIKCTILVRVMCAMLVIVVIIIIISLSNLFVSVVQSSNNNVYQSLTTNFVELSCSLIDKNQYRNSYKHRIEHQNEKIRQ